MGREGPPGALRRVGSSRPRLAAQVEWNAKQVRLDNEILDYVDARLAATHRHYDAVLGHTGRHLGEIDERHMILQEELVAHVHDLVKRIDLVLAEAEKGRLGLEHGLRDVQEPPSPPRGAPRPRMKTVLVCGVQAPFITGGAEILVAELRVNLERRGFRVDVANVPFKWYPVSEIVRQALAWRLLDVTESNGTPVDLVIPTKFPSYLVRHPRKVTWLFHQHREAYDLFGTPYGSFTDGPEDARVREAIVAMDTDRRSASAGTCSRSPRTSRTGSRATTTSTARPSIRRPSTSAATATTPSATTSSTPGASTA